LLTGVSRAFTHQLVRHRAGFSFSQLSQQYHDESDAKFVVPFGLAENPQALEVWERVTKGTMDAYRNILKCISDLPSLDRKEALRAIRSAARSILPNATETSIVVTANARSLRHFLAV